VNAAGIRRAHLVGSIPAATAADAMRLAVERLGPDLDYLPDGETGERRNWLISMIDGLHGHPDLRLVREGDWSDYGKTPRFALRPGHGTVRIRAQWPRDRLAHRHARS
jgi:hypothetical protein